MSESTSSTVARPTNAPDRVSIVTVYVNLNTGIMARGGDPGVLYIERDKLDAYRAELTATHGTLVAELLDSETQAIIGWRFRGEVQWPKDPRTFTREVWVMLIPAPYVNADARASLVEAIILAPSTPAKPARATKSAKIKTPAPDAAPPAAAPPAPDVAPDPATHGDRNAAHNRMVALRAAVDLEMRREAAAKKDNNQVAAKKAANAAQRAREEMATIIKAFPGIARTDQPREG